MHISKPRSGAVLVRISGYDTGQFGDAPFEAIRGAIAESGPIELFCDLRAAGGAKTDVREAWTRCFNENRPGLRRVVILVESKFVQTAVEVAKLFSRTGDLITVSTDAGAFEQAVARGGSAAPRSAAE